MDQTWDQMRNFVGINNLRRNKGKEGLVYNFRCGQVTVVVFVGQNSVRSITKLP